MDPVHVLLAWVLAAMTSWVPYTSNRAETKEEAQSRYESIAQAAVAANYDPAYPPFALGNRAASTILTLSVAKDESDFRKDVFTGIGPKARGDQGRSFCLMQVQVGQGSIDVGEQSWFGIDLLEDPNKCFLAGLKKLRASWGECHELPMRDRLSAYVTGRCTEANWQSRMRVDRAVKWLQHNRPPVKDADVILGLQKQTNQSLSLAE